MVNPTYEAQNLNNEARYPYLSSRTTHVTETPPLTAKLGDGCSDRRTSGCYDEPDEDRYTSLKAIEEAATGYDNAAKDGKHRLR